MKTGVGARERETERWPTGGREAGERRVFHPVEKGVDIAFRASLLSPKVGEKEARPHHASAPKGLGETFYRGSHTWVR